jgi:hypothetical protein
MDEDKRATALNSITTVGKEYISLSDGTKIGKKVLKDLKKLMELELREKYKIVKNKWKVVSEADKDSKQQLLTKKYYKEIKDAKLIKRITDKYESNKEKIGKITQQITERKSLLYSKNIDYDDDNLLNELIKKKQELEELVEIDYITKETISFNSIIVINGDYFLPYVVINDNPKDIAVIINDKKELDKIFREKHFKSFDDSVILEFYNEITKKLSDTKDFIRKTDVNIRNDIIEDLYKKLFAIYDIKEHNLKDKDKYSKQIKEEYINKKIARNNSLSFGGAREGKGFFEDTKSAIGTIAEASLPDPRRAAVRGVAEGVKNAWEVSKKVKASMPMPIVSIAKVIENRQNERAKFTDADKFVMTLFEENLDESPDNLSIKILQDLVNHLDKNSRYKKDIKALIGFNQAILDKNEQVKTDEANKQSENKSATSKEFIEIALGKYKKLKKSFMDKVASDKKSLDEQLQEGADKDFIKKISFAEIVEADNRYIENVKGLYSYLQNIEIEQTGGAPQNDIEKKENSDDKDKSVTPYDFYKILKENYIEIVTLYYKLIDGAGDEEKHYDFIYKYDGINTTRDNEDTSNKTHDDDEKQNTGFNKYKAALEFIKDNLDTYLPVGAKSTNIINNVLTSANLTELIDLCGKYDIIVDTVGRDIKDLKKIFNDILVHDIQTKQERFEESLLGRINNLLLKDQGLRWQDSLEKNEKLKNAIELIAEGKTYENDLVNALKIQLNPRAKDEIERKKTSNKAILLINELKEKIRLLESRIDVLGKIETKLPTEFKKIYKTISKMKTIPQSTEYEDYIINILKSYKINFFEKDKETDRHPIIKAIKSEKAQVEDKLKKIKSELIEQEKERKAQVDIQKAQGRGYEQRFGNRYNEDNHVGGTYDNGIDTEKLKIDLKIDKVSLKDKHKDYYNFVSDDDNNSNNLHYFMKELKDNIEHLENEEGIDNNGVGRSKIDSDREKGIYENIWYDYREAVNKPNNKGAEKYLNDLLFLTEGEKLHERVIENDLDPEIVLKINFRDKAIYIFLIFLIRTINIITLEFLIEYNLMQNLQYAIVFYGFMYLLIIIFLIAIVNYDSYKLRIIFNYLNIHINAPNLLVQNVLFIIFIILVYILVKSDDFLKYFGDLLDYTKIYNNMYNYTKSIDDDYYTNLTQNEKLKLLYRIDIISMIIFIFSAFLVLIL